jgi:DNA topoisomerase I
LGINATRLYTIKYGQSRQVLSIGRVQTPTLALIVNRQLEIDNFVSQPYWELKTIYRDTVFSVTKGRFSTVEEGEVFLQQVQGGPFEVVDIAKKQGKESPPRLFDLTSLQVECNKKFAYSAEDTLKLIQSLYEKKVTTYPRVDTTFLSDDIYPKVPNILQVLQTSQVYEPLINPLWRSNLPKSKKVFDNSKVTDHHAIIPTNVRPSNLTDNERKVYDLVVRRFIAAFYPDCRVATTTVLGKVGNIEFKATGKQIIEPGWRIVFEKEKDVEKEEKDTDEERVLPDFVKGESGPHEPALGEKWTQPPKYYTEATLLRAMETAGRLVENDELRDALKENGIGRPSTRAAIIETLFKRNYIRKERKNLLATQTGIELIAIIHEELLKSAELTGIWENKLRRIERNEYRAKDFLEELKLMVAEIVNKVKHDQAVRSITIQTPLGVQASNTEKEKNDTITKKGRKVKEKKKNEGLSSRKEDTQGKSIQVIQSEPILCPVCGKGYIVKGKTAYGCSDWKDGCNFRLSFDEYGENLVDSDLKIIVQKFRDSMAGGLSLFPE